MRGRSGLLILIATITNVTSIRQGLTGTPTYSGTGKGGGAQYPDAVQVGNYLYVSYSMQKESIGFSRVLIPGLADDNSDAWPSNYQAAVTINVGKLNVGTLRAGQ